MIGGKDDCFLLHNIFALRKLIPSGLMFPISATMLKNPALYDLSLEQFSKPLMQCLDYELNEMGEMNVEQDNVHFYKYLDLTIQTEVLINFILKTIYYTVFGSLKGILTMGKPISKNNTIYGKCLINI